MANRSKKVMLSARVDPYLKVGLDLLAESRGIKMVKVLEAIIENGLSDATVKSDLKSGVKSLPFLTLLTAIWSEDEVLLRLRVGVLGPPFAGERSWRMSMVVTGSEYFRGDFDLFGDMNGMADTYEFDPPRTQKLNLERAREEWSLVGEYVDFLESNKPIEPTYKQYKAMRVDAALKG